MSNRARQRGNILIPVMLIGIICTLVMSALINREVYLEQAAVENRLAEIRAYWATMGHFRYAISRMRRAGLCPDSAGCGATQNIKDSDKVTALQSYLDEISNLRTFTYADENSNYSIKIAVTAATDDDPSRQIFSGHLMITSSYPGVGVSILPVLSGLPQRFTPYQMRICTSLTTAYAPCGAVSANNNNGRPTGLYSVKRFYRLNSTS
jgi:hypothetical protein